MLDADSRGLQGNNAARQKVFRTSNAGLDVQTGCCTHKRLNAADANGRAGGWLAASGVPCWEPWGDSCSYHFSPSACLIKTGARRLFSLLPRHARPHHLSRRTLQLATQPPNHCPNIQPAASEATAQTLCFDQQTSPRTHCRVASPRPPAKPPLRTSGAPALPPAPSESTGICIRAKGTLSDSTLPPSCNHFAVRGNLAVCITVATASPLHHDHASSHPYTHSRELASTACLFSPLQALLV